VTTIFPGNIETSEAELMIQHIEDVLFSGPNPVCQPLFSSQHAANRVVKLGFCALYDSCRKILGKISSYNSIEYFKLTTIDRN